ncbi:hypothetical protein ACLOJK_001521 [Asimina triloba]
MRIFPLTAALLLLFSIGANGLNGQQGDPPGRSELTLNYYSESCPRAEEIVKDQSCDASLLLDAVDGKASEKDSDRNFGMRNFKYVNAIKSALESECPMTVSCADIIALSARDGVVMLGGPQINMKTGRRDSKESHAAEVADFIPQHNDSISVVLSQFQSMGIDAEGTVALLGISPDATYTACP